MKLFSNFDEWIEFSSSPDFHLSKKVLRSINNKFWFFGKWYSKFPGECGVCNRQTEFYIDGKHAVRNDLGGVSSKFIAKKVNFRERLECSYCHLNQRMRSGVQIVNHLLDPHLETRIWIQEAVTPLWKHFDAQYSNLLGSEYFGSEIPSGQMKDNIRHEDATKSSFQSESLGGVLSFDVLEHVPDFLKAFNETLRVLEHGGVYCWSAPFNLFSYENQIRASVDENGHINHILPPEYHGDPINPSEGILCFQTFGWEVLDDLRSIGFKDVKVLWDNNPRKGILSLENVFIVAYK